MTSSKLQRPPNDYKPMIKELIKGRKLAEQIGAILRETSAGENSAAEVSLIEEITGTFARAIAAIGCGVQETSGVGCAAKRKMQTTQNGAQYRKRSRSCSSEKVKSRTLSDGNSWRKYGQKAIYGNQYPRSYFRCTHKNDQGCQATRQVQQSEEDPTVFEITYFGKHTCRDPAEATAYPQLGEEDSCIIDFANHNQPRMTSLKQDADEDVVSKNTRETPASSSEVDALERSLQFSNEFAGSGFEQSDVSSGLQPWSFQDNYFDFSSELDEFFWEQL